MIASLPGQFPPFDSILEIVDNRELDLAGGTCRNAKPFDPLTHEGFVGYEQKKLLSPVQAAILRYLS